MVKFLLAPRPQKDPLAADHEAPQNVLVPKDGTDINVIREKLPDFDPDIFESAKQTKVGMLERAHNADGITFDPDILQAMSKDFDFNDPNNILDDDFMDQAGGLIEDEGEMLDDDADDLTNELFADDPEVITFDQLKQDDAESLDSDEYDVDQETPQNSAGLSWQDEKKDDEPFGYGKRLILFKKASKPAQVQSAKQLQDELNAHFRPENQRLLHLKSQMSADDQAEDVDQFSECDSQDDRKTVFTNYSLTSSVMRRNQGLQQIDEHFERLYEKEYADDTEIGALDLNGVKGEDLLSDVNQIRQLKNEVKIVRKRNHGDNYEPEIVSDHHKNAIIGEGAAEEEDDLVEVEIQRRENKIDCESILSYNSNLYNHPRLIVEPRRSRKSSSTTDQMEIDDTRSRSGKGQSIASSRASILSKLSVRPTNESLEDKRARKKALKQYRQERRQERKQNQQIFKTERAIFTKQQKLNQPNIKLA